MSPAMRCDLVFKTLNNKFVISTFYFSVGSLSKFPPLDLVFFHEIISNSFHALLKLLTTSFDNLMCTSFKRSSVKTLFS